MWLTLFGEFARIGATAFGGGSATLLAMRKLCVEKHAWMTTEQYMDSFVLSRLVPGINILGQVILIGRHVGGYVGSAVSLLGLMAPASLITVAFSAGYELVRAMPAARGPLAAISALVAGFTVALVYDLARNVIRPSLRRRDLALLGCFGCCALLGLTPMLVLAVSAVAGWAFPRIFAEEVKSECSGDEP